jgi:hypothetical protein
MLTELDQRACEHLSGGFTRIARELTEITGTGLARGPETIQISVSPVIFTAPLLRQTSNSFNFFGNRDSFNSNFKSYFGVS